MGVSVPVQKLTKDVFNNLPIPAVGSRAYVWDETVKGFGLMITDKGALSYILQYRLGGRGSPTRRVTIGKHGSPWTPAAARKRALELLEQVRRKIDPFDVERELVAAAKRTKAEVSAQAAIASQLAFETIAARYIDKGTWTNGSRIRSWATYDRIIVRDLVPQFGSTPLTQISAEDISELLTALAERGVSAARRAHIVLTNIFNFAARVEKRHFKAKNSPMLDVESPGQAAKRDRHLSDDELRLVWIAAGDLAWPWCDVVRQLILSGQRLREVAHVRRSELNFKASEWIIDGSRTKNGDAHLVPITATALGIWQSTPTIKNDNDLIFPSSAGTALSAMSKMKQKLDDKIIELMRMEVTASGGDPGEIKLKEWRFHDLRRTVAVGLQRLKVPREVIDEVLNHRTGGRTGITGVYQVYRFQAEKLEALSMWDDHLNSVVSAENALVEGANPRA